jgi:hypothetical protein
MDGRSVEAAFVAALGRREGCERAGPRGCCAEAGSASPSDPSRLHRAKLAALAAAGGSSKAEPVRGKVVALKG